MIVNDYKENYGSGWIKLHRSIKNHWLFSNDKFFKWWVTLLIEVNHKDNKIQLGYSLHEIKRGQSAKSLRNWAKLLNCDVKQFVKFLDLLENDKMISRKTLGKGKQSTTLVNINNYSQYQGGNETQGTTQQGTQGKRDGGTNNNDNKEKNEKELVNEIYSSYPSTCPIKKRTTGKSTKDKEKIKQLLKIHSADELKEIISRYIKDCKKTETYVKNFKTFLNNLPDYSDLDKPQVLDRPEHLSVGFCRTILQVQPELDKVLAKGYTLEQIKTWAEC